VRIPREQLLERIEQGVPNPICGTGDDDRHPCLDQEPYQGGKLRVERAAADERGDPGRVLVHGPRLHRDPPV